ncbi:MAG: TfoX/Sxy family protein [Planctomycetaceae bacterium]|nr:TfoX/Sxy family protein [Planctomycetaceae bacterium]
MAMTEDDTRLLDRLRLLVKDRRGFSEKKMFGGICLMLNGNMCVGTWQGSLVVRLDKADHEQTQADAHTAPMDITGRVMKGWALVRPAGVATDHDLKHWLDRAAAFVATLPAK